MNKEETYYNISAKWWADEARKGNKDYALGLSEELFKDFEEKLANQIKKDVEYLINDLVKYNEKVPCTNRRKFTGISLSKNDDILVNALRRAHIGCVRPVLPMTKMLVLPTLVFSRDFDIWEYKRFDDPCSVDTDRVLFENS